MHGVQYRFPFDRGEQRRRNFDSDMRHEGFVFSRS
ncbi:hypothetical protein J2W24_003117 [Variovorax boronicumulans]|nr:hypothetical protein [Variovorax boronicumulans]